MRTSLTAAVAFVLTTGSFATASALPRYVAPHIDRTHNGAGRIPPIGGGPVNRGVTIVNALQRLGARYVGPAAPRLMTVNVATPMRNERALKAYVVAANTPTSYYYRRWLTPVQIGNAFGTPARDYMNTLNYFRGFGLRVNGWSPRTLIAVTGSSAKLERALGTRFGNWTIKSPDGRVVNFVAPASGLTLPKTLAVADFSGLVTLPTIRTNAMIGAPPQPVNGGFSTARINGLSPKQLARAYDLTGAYEAGFSGKGINLGIIGTGPISLEDVPNYKKLFNVGGTSGAVTIVPTLPTTSSSTSGDSTPPPVTGPCMGGTSTVPTPTCNPEDEEAQLDTEQTAGLAPDASILFYLAYNGSVCNGATVGGMCVGGTSANQGLFLADDELMQAVSDNRADILSLSYGGCEDLDVSLGALTPVPGGDATGTDPTIFAELAAEGIATFVSSGDSGSAGCQRLITMNNEPNASYPSSDPNVVSVGGTTTPVGGDGRLSGPITTWGQQTKSGGAEGAGQSKVFQTPPYQKGVAAVASQCAMRCQPDVVLDADPFTGAAVIFNSGAGQGGAMESPIGGTSQAAPDMAATWAVVLSACKATPSCGGGTFGVSDPVPGFTAPAAPKYRLGNPNYLWYALADTANAAAFHSTFYDIVYGNDAVPAANPPAPTPADPYSALAPGSVSAGPGFDQATGLGAPFGRALIKYVVKI